MLEKELKKIFESDRALQILGGSPKQKGKFVFKDSDFEKNKPDWIDSKKKKDDDSSSSEEKVKKPKTVDDNIDKREWRRLQIL